MKIKLDPAKSLLTFTRAYYSKKNSFFFCSFEFYIVSNYHFMTFHNFFFREHDKFLTTVYRKATFTGQYLHFQSFCSKKRNVNLIRTLCHRAHMICSPELLQKELNKIKDVFIKNGLIE